MDIVFAKKNLADLYEDNAAARNQVDYSAERTCRFITIINMIRASTGLDDLRTRRCLNYRTLTPNHGGLSTVRVDESHLLIVEDGSYNFTRQLIVRAFVHLKRRLTKQLHVHKQAQLS